MSPSCPICCVKARNADYRTASVEVIVIDMVMLAFTVATILILFYGSKKIFPADFRQPQFFLTFIIVMVPLIIQFYQGLALLNYDSAAKMFGWSSPLPLEPSSPLLVGAVVFYIGQVAWLWSRWRKVA
jgi:hypothetical protein